MIFIIIVITIVIPYVLYKIANRYNNSDKNFEDYSNSNNYSPKTVLDIQLKLGNQKIQLYHEIKELKKKQKTIMNQFITSIYMEQKNFDSKKVSVVNDEFYGVEIHCDFCDEIYSIKERRCPNCKAENPYWKNISDFE